MVPRCHGELGGTFSIIQHDLIIEFGKLPPSYGDMLIRCDDAAKISCKDFCLENVCILEYNYKT